MCRRFFLAANATWRFDDNIICEDFRKPIDVAGVECFRPFLERFHAENPMIRETFSLTNVHADSKSVLDPDVVTVSMTKTVLDCAACSFNYGPISFKTRGASSG